MATKHLMQGGLVVSMTAPVTTNGGLTSGSMLVNNAQDVFVVVSSRHAAGDATTFTLQQDDGTGGAWVAISANIWASENVGTIDVARVTNANNYITDANANDKIIIFRLDADSMTAGFDRIRVTSSNSGEATNFASVVGFHLPARYS